MGRKKAFQVANVYVDFNLKHKKYINGIKIIFQLSWKMFYL